MNQNAIDSGSPRDSICSKTALGKCVERAEDLGLSLAESKVLLAAAQQRIVEAQTKAWTEGRRCCEDCRVGKRFVGAHFHPEVARQLKMLAAEDDRTIQELLEDAVDLLFVKAGKAKIAELVKKP